MDQALVGLPAEVPDPDLPLDALTAILGILDRQLPLRRPRSDRRVARFPCRCSAKTSARPAVLLL